MAIRTDMAAESFSQVQTAQSGAQLKGVSVSTETIEKARFEVTDILIEETDAAERLGKPCGRYITLKALDSPFDMYSDRLYERAEVIAEKLRELSSNAGRVLVAGLGNVSITPDAVGPLAADRVFATRHIKSLDRELDTEGLADMTVIRTGVLGQTGVEAGEQVKLIAELVKPDAVIAVDALACSDMENLGRTVQLCDTGISPGSGVENARKELSEATLGVKCIAVGVPTVVDLNTAAEHIFGREVPDDSSNMMVTPKSVDRLAENCARMISLGINRAFHSSLSPEDIESLI